MAKKRLDISLMALYPQYSRTQINSFIIQGKVTVGGTVCAKPGTLIAHDAEIMIIAEPPRFVCRAGIKLEHALTTFGINVTGLTVLDAGLSTGGFTDCLLQHGARRVYGIDVGYGQVHERVRQDSRVVVRERTNLRTYEHVGDPIDLVTLDLSFISIIKVLPAVKKLLPEGKQLVTLIKPQFEAQRGEVPKGGVIKDVAQRDAIVSTVVRAIEAAGFICAGLTPSPIEGSAGNVEYVAHFYRQPEQQLEQTKEKESKP